MNTDYDYPAKDLHLTVKVRNAAMVRWRREHGLTRAGAARMVGVSPAQWGWFESLGKDPLKKTRWGRVEPPTWSVVASRIATGMGMLPEDVFTEGVRSVVKTELETEVNSEELTSRLSDVSVMRHRLAYMPDPEFMLRKKEITDAVREAMSSLPEREQLVIRRRFWEDKTLGEVGAELGLTREGIRQIERKALRKLRHKSRSVKIRDAGGDEPNGGGVW
jgi:RNA polymerase primary sigma factor